MTMDSLIKDFLEYLEIEKGLSPLTIRDYRQKLQRFSTWLNQNYPECKPKNIDLEVIRKYRLYLAHLYNQTGSPLKKVTQNYHIIVLRAFLRYLLARRDILTLSPDKIELAKQSSRSVNFLNLDQINRLLASPEISDEVGLRDRAILETLFSTGLRVSELVHLNRGQINLERKEFGVRGKGSKVE